MTTPAPIGVTLGDPAGIGPEIVVKALAEPAWRERCVAIGDPDLLARTAARLGLPPPARIDPIGGLPADLPIGRVDARAGDAAYRYVVRGIDLALRGDLRALVTAPLSKEAMNLAGHAYPGHTELLAERAGNVPVRMMLANPELRTVLVSIHVPLRDALALVTVDRVLETIAITDRALRRAGIAAPRVAVAGLNPHAGENGLLGREEIDVIAPAIARARASGIDASGPHPPDTVYMRARGLREFDVVIAMYHDQGLIPVKYLGLDEGVNVTLGLPFVRTSPDHGTAFDIAGRGRADPRSLLAALAHADALAPASN
jgi:4-hydroxythreonine-4-phosphate dehydrogenase